MPRLPKRIACLSTEAAEILYELGEEDRIVGISGFTTRPARARKEKPKISGFSTGKLERILAVEPDLVLGFSDMQGDICRELVKAGIEVHHFNQRSVEGIFAMIETLGRLVGAEARALALVGELEAKVALAIRSAAGLTRRPKVYFEEWNEPLIAGIRWVSELITIAGGNDVFADLASQPSAKGRLIGDPQTVVQRQPDIIIGSWCGKRFQPEQLRIRPGWDSIPAVKAGELHEIKSALILSPGPAAIREGLPQLASIIRRWVEAGPTAG